MEIEMNEQRKYIAELLKQHEEFILVGLTGRVGSGCSEAAEIFGSTYEELELPHVSVGTRDLKMGDKKEEGLESDAKRDRRILLRYASHHWLRFDVIRVRTVIVSFLLNRMDHFCEEVVTERPAWGGEKHSAEVFQKELVDRTSEELKALSEKRYTYSMIEEQVTLVGQLIQQTGKNDVTVELARFKEYWKNLSGYMSNSKGPLTISNKAMMELGELFKVLYDVADKPEYYQNRTPILKAVDELLEMVSGRVASMWWEKKMKGYSSKTVSRKLSEIGKFLMQREKSNGTDTPMFYEYMLVHDIIPALTDTIHRAIAQRDSSLFTELFQKYGNSIRRYGDVSFEDGKDIPEKQKDRIGDNAFAIPRRINQFIKAFRHPFNHTYARPTRIVIDSIKSELEATYLRERYSAFYLFAISTDDSIRERRLINSAKKKLNIRDIRIIDWNEFSTHGAKIYGDYKNEAKQAMLDEDEIEFAKVVGGEQGETTHVVDTVRKWAYENGLQQFVLQDVGAAIQNADVFISNNHDSAAKNMDLRWEIVRSVSLIMYPGLLLPTPIERCMQAAFNAKANSGCLSRQVGAVVTDAEYNILSMGWNDVPDCDISCARKNLLDIQKELDLPAYSKYELENKDFRNRLERIFGQNMGDDRQRLGELLCGLPWSYCFKDIHRDDRQPMRSRAMHGEEKALAKVPEQVPGGCLFTTSSPCEMCSKNAKNHHIMRIYYIEQYPGISADQYSESGYTCNRAEHILFTGAIGRAYIQMYTPIMPHKDVLKFMGMDYRLK